MFKCQKSGLLLEDTVKSIGGKLSGFIYTVPLGKTAAESRSIAGSTERIGSCNVLRQLDHIPLLQPVKCIVVESGSYYRS